MMEFTTAALQWPKGWKREQDPSYSAFKISLEPAMRGLARQLELMHARNVRITLNAQFRPDGVPYVRQSNIDDTGVAAYFELEDDQGNWAEHAMPCDKWVHIQDNVHAIELSVQALRGLNRWGSSSYARAAFTGYKALPAQGIEMPAGKKAWYEVLGVAQDAGQSVVRAAYKSKATKAHPDGGGTLETWQELQDAYMQGLDSTSNE